jgi:hypothetical protein
VSKSRPGPQSNSRRKKEKKKGKKEKKGKNVAGGLERSALPPSSIWLDH